ncbi:MAG: hypothetical protein HDT43_06765 [Ruminococcaceae bacterium]|nr:hypothetical protein [Oscillospiraceae bacterium]
MTTNKHKNQKTSIRTQMIIMVSLVFTLLIVGTVTAGIIAGYVGIEKTVNADLVTIQQFSEHTFSVALEQAFDEALKPAAEFDRTVALGTHNALKYADKMLEDSFFRECGVVLKTGETRSSYDILSDARIPELDCVKKVLAGETEDAKISSTIDLGGELRFIVAVPCKSGAFLLTVDGSYFSDLISDKKIGTTGNIFLIDNDGKMIANADPSVVSAQTNYIEKSGNDKSHASTAELFKKMMSGETGVSKFNYNGVKSICAYGTVDGSDGWAYGVAAPESEMLSAMVMIIIALIVCSLVFLAGGIVAISVYATKMSKPIMQMSKRMTLMARGDLYTPIDSINRTDEIGVLAYEFGGTLVSLKSYIRDLGEVLHEMSRGNMLAMPQIEYDGDFSSIEKSLKKIQKSLNHTFSEINKSSNLVAEEANQVSADAQTLARGAAEQTEVIQSLMDMLTTLSESSANNSRTTKNAAEHAVKAGDQVKYCNEKMQNAADAMAEITNSALQIEKIIATIEDIAYQTNILALNAEIEAAAAGSAGKGFAVVADEVRNLANKSDKAAKATKQLIDSSLESVNRGSEVVNMVSEQLNESTEVVLRAVEDMKTVDEAVQREEENMREISENIKQINRVIQSNNATSAKSAETSRTLSIQAENLKSLMSNFRCTESD